MIREQIAWQDGFEELGIEELRLRWPECGQESCHAVTVPEGEMRKLKAIEGVIASGSLVIEDEATMGWLVGRDRRLRALEIEGEGVAVATGQATAGGDRRSS